MSSEVVASVGAGRMGRGIAIAFAYAGHEVMLIDAKPRDAAGFDSLHLSAMKEIESTLGMMADLGMLSAEEVPGVAARVTCVALKDAADALARADVVFEGVPEVMAAKKDAFALISDHARATAIVASTTSTILSNDLQGLVSEPERFLNAHWLNPAFLVPLVEVSPGDRTEEKFTQRLMTLLEGIGKVPIRCTASPGYIVPRIQILAMNEAARMVEEGVATAEDMDKATKYGFGFRFAILGLLEFIDWGGGDILFHASNYMTDATGEDRFAAPQIIKDNMAKGRNGLRDGKGFLDYDRMDVPAYQRERLAAFVAMLGHMGKMPRKG